MKFVRYPTAIFWLRVAVSYNQLTQSLIISGRAQSTVASIDYETGEVNWLLGDHFGWTGALATKLLSPVNEQGDLIDVSDEDFWPYGQHAATTLPNGNILMYDNGLYRNFYRDQSASFNSYSRAVEYAIDTENMTIRKVWQFDYDKTLFTPFTGDVDFFASNEHLLLSYMWGSNNTPRIVELDNNDNIVFEAIVDAGENYYRAEKIALYENID